MREYVTFDMLSKRAVWRVLEGDGYTAQPMPPDGILRSRVSPGVWLDVAAFWVDDAARLNADLNAGLASTEPREFVERLAVAKR